MLTPAKALLTGNPSPSKPGGAVVTDFTGRSWVATGSGDKTRGRVKTFSTVTAGIQALLNVLSNFDDYRAKHYLRAQYSGVGLTGRVRQGSWSYPHVNRS